MQKVCYLPLTTLLLKPLHRVLHYQLLLEREFRFYSKGQFFQENRDQGSKIDTYKVLNKWINDLFKKNHIYAGGANLFKTKLPNQTEFCFIFVSNPRSAEAAVESSVDVIRAHKTVHHKLDTGVKKPASNTYIGDQGL